MAAGPMRERVSFQSPSRDKNPSGYGGVDVSYTTVHTVWAQVSPVHGNEAFLGDAADPAMSHRVLVRHEEPLDEITPEWRILWGNRELGITSVANIAARDRILEFLCREPK